MKHLTEEQFEDILQDPHKGSRHLDECTRCGQRLAEKRALANRLRSAFAGVEAPAGLAESIRRQINVASVPGSHRKIVPGRHSRWKNWALGIAAAAAMLLLAPAVLYYSQPGPAMAMQAQLVQIHRDNLATDHDFHTEADPGKLAEYFRHNLGFDIRVPQVSRGMAIRGCCISHFRSGIIGSYVVDTDRGAISVIVVADTAESLGDQGSMQTDGRTLWKGSFSMCHMVSLRVGDYTYCAVGEMSHADLAEFLTRLIPAE